MARKRGFFAELQYQAQQAEKRKLLAQQHAYRAQQQLQRQHEKAVKDLERAQAQLARATAQERKHAEAAAKQARIAAREAEVAERNAALANAYAEIDGLLQTTLGVDDFVDLEELRQIVQHPPFPHSSWSIPCRRRRRRNRPGTCVGGAGTTPWAVWQKGTR